MQAVTQEGMVDPGKGLFARHQEVMGVENFRTVSIETFCFLLQIA